MRAPRSRSLLLAGLMCALTALPVAALADPDGQEPQTLAVDDSRTGDGPCGFAVRQDIEGTIPVTTSLDGTGHLVLVIEAADLQGKLTNPANGKSIELRWVTQNGKAGFNMDGPTTTMAVALTGYFLRGYADISRGDLPMDLPADGAELAAFEAGAHSADPWAQVCGQLAS